MKEDNFFKGVFALWVLGVLLTVGFWGFLGWAIYRVVTAYT